MMNDDDVFMDGEVNIVFQVSAVDLSCRNRDGLAGIVTRLQT